MEKISMRVTRLMPLTLLTILIFSIGNSSARQQQLQPQKGGGNSESTITREVRHELMSVPWYSVFDILQYSVNGNEVTLKGEVTQPTVKSDAVNAVKHIEGVQKVND